MTEKDPQTGEIELPKTDEKEELEAIMANLGGKGYQLVIHRTAPAWCGGYLDTLPMDEPITLADIRDSYGGKRFQLKVQKPEGGYLLTRSIRIAGEPKVDGKFVPSGGTYEKGGQVIVQPPPDPSEKILLAFKEAQEKNAAALKEAQDRNHELMMEMLSRKEKQIDPLSQLETLLGAVTTVRKFGDELGGSEPSTTAQVLSMFSEFMKDKKQTDTKTVRKPVVHREKLPPPQTNAAKENPATTSDTIEPEEELPSIVDELIEAGPQETAEVLAEVLQAWTPEQQQEAFQAMMSAGSARVDNDDSIEQNISSSGETDANSE